MRPPSTVSSGIEKYQRLECLAVGHRASDHGTLAGGLEGKAGVDEQASPVVFELQTAPADLRGATANAGTQRQFRAAGWPARCSLSGRAEGSVRDASVEVGMRVGRCVSSGLTAGSCLEPSPRVLD